MTIALSTASIDSQAFWLDELGTWYYSTISNPVVWATRFLDSSNSDGQLPLYHALTYLWARLGGSGPVWLRAENTFLLFAALTSVYTCASPRNERLAFGVFVVTNCFVWAYLNEARPYMMIVAGSSFLLTSILQVQSFRTTDNPSLIASATIRFVIGTVLSFGGSPTTAPLVLLTLCASILLLGKHRGWKALTIAVRYWPVIAVGAVICLIAASIIINSILQGATPELRNQTSLASISFGFLEIVGGAGYLPGREQLRVSGVEAIQPWQWFALFALLSATGVVVSFGLLRKDGWISALLTVTCLIAVAAVATAGYLIGFRVLGRHFAFLLPFLAWLLARGTMRSAGVLRGLPAVLVLLLLGSSITFRLADYHKKDDTGEVARLMQAAINSGEEVWFLGGQYVPLYFNIPNSVGLDKAAALQGKVQKPLPVEAEVINQDDAPVMIAVERPETNDADNFWAATATRLGLSNVIKLRGYVVYRSAVY